MNRFIVLLRGINVSGKNKLPMKELRELLTFSGFQNVATYIQSGNIVLESQKSPKEVESDIFNLIKEKYDYEVPAFAYTVHDWEKIINECPYEEGEKKVYFTFLSEATKIKELEVNKAETDEFTIKDHMVYLYCLSYGKTKLSNNLFENKLKVTATSRNFRTVYKLLELAQ